MNICQNKSSIHLSFTELRKMFRTGQLYLSLAHRLYTYNIYIYYWYACVYIYIIDMHVYIYILLICMCIYILLICMCIYIYIIDMHVYIYIYIFIFLIFRLKIVVKDVCHVQTCAIHTMFRRVPWLKRGRRGMVVPCYATIMNRIHDNTKENSKSHTDYTDIHGKK